MQYLSPVGSGPSSKMCPRWASQRLQSTSTRFMPWLPSVWVSTAALSTGA